MRVVWQISEPNIELTKSTSALTSTYLLAKAYTNKTNDQANDQANDRANPRSS